MARTLGEVLQGRRFGLVMSAGFFGFYGHAGFLKGLRRAGLEPAAYAGTSAGGLIAAYAAGGASVEDIEAHVLSQTRASFWDPDPIGAVRGFRKHGFTGLLGGARFRDLLSSTLPVRSFEECRSPLVLVAADLSFGRPRVFDTGQLAPAVHATCAYPGLFRAVRLGEHLFWDGGLVDKAPALALAESRAGNGLEAILVHYLPSRAATVLRGAFAYAQGISTAVATLRREHFRLQLQLLAARGLPVYVVTSRLPQVSPMKMDRGAQALETATRAAHQALHAPPVPFEG